MTRFHTAFAPAALLGAALLGAVPFQAAAAEQPPITIRQQGENFDIEYAPGYTANIVSRSVVRSQTGGESGTITYDSVRAQPPLFAHIYGGGESQQIIYSRSPDLATALAEAGLVPGAPATLFATRPAAPRG